MTRIKGMLLDSALAIALLPVLAVATDFHVLRELRGAVPAPVDAEVLAATEGGALCTVAVGSINVTADSGTIGGVCLISILVLSTGAVPIFAVANALLVFAANFLQVL